MNEKLQKDNEYLAFIRTNLTALAYEVADIAKIIKDCKASFARNEVLEDSKRSEIYFKAKEATDALISFRDDAGRPIGARV